MSHPTMSVQSIRDVAEKDWLRVEMAGLGKYGAWDEITPEVLSALAGLPAGLRIEARVIRAPAPMHRCEHGRLIGWPCTVCYLLSLDIPVS